MFIYRFDVKTDKFVKNILNGKNVGYGQQQSSSRFVRMVRQIGGMWTNGRQTHTNNENIAQLSEIMNLSFNLRRYICENLSGFFTNLDRWWILDRSNR